MRTLLEIVNSALASTGQHPIEGFPPVEDTTLSRLCDVQIRDTVSLLIASHQWGFASKEAALTVVSGETSSLGSYVYQLPADCLRVWEVLPVGRYNTEWTIIGSRLISDVADASILYQSETAVNGPFPIWFADAAAWHMASTLLPALSKVPTSSSSFDFIHIVNDKARRALNRALVIDLNQRNRIGMRESATSDSFITG